MEPLRRYHRLRRRARGVETYRLFDVFVPLVEHDVRYPYDQVGGWIADSVAPLGREYQQQVRRALDEGWIDVYENAGKRSGAYSAPVYGAHPYMLLNYNETLDAVFTLAHEMGHSMHTLLSHQSQPFVYAGYTIFVAEVPSTLNEALFLDLMLERARSREERMCCSTRHRQHREHVLYAVLFAIRTQENRLVEQDRPITADRSTGCTRVAARLLRRRHWTRRDLTCDVGAHPHFFNTPYYVYQ